MNKLFLILFLFSCNPMPKISYFKDEKTGLCYAKLKTKIEINYTCVPCENVKKFIKK